MTPIKTVTWHPQAVPEAVEAEKLACLLSAASQEFFRMHRAMASTPVQFNLIYSKGCVQIRLAEGGPRPLLTGIRYMTYTSLAKAIREGVQAAGSVAAFLEPGKQPEPHEIPDTARTMLIGMYRDYFSNYLTVETYAEQHGLLVEEARTLLELARKVDSHPHPES